MSKLHGLCIEAVKEMHKEGIEKHTSYANVEDNLPFDIPVNVKVPKVTIEWVDAKEVVCKHENTARVTGIGLHCTECGEDV